MKKCHKYRLTTDEYRPKGTMPNEKVCLLADRVDISNRKMQIIMKEFSDTVGRELMDCNLRGALTERLNSTSEFYYSKQIKFTNKKGEERTTSFICMKDLKERIEEIMMRRCIKNAMVVISLDGGQDKLVSTLAIFEEDLAGEETRAEEQEPTVDTAEDVADLQKQLAEAREQLRAQDQIIEVK